MYCWVAGHALQHEPEGHRKKRYMFPLCYSDRGLKTNELSLFLQNACGARPPQMHLSATVPPWVCYAKFAEFRPDVAAKAADKGKKKNVLNETSGLKTKVVVGLPI